MSELSPQKCMWYCNHPSLLKCYMLKATNKLIVQCQFSGVVLGCKIENGGFPERFQVLFLYKQTNAYDQSCFHPIFEFLKY